MKKFILILALLPALASAQTINTVAGYGYHPIPLYYSGDGGPATTAGISQVSNVAVDHHGNIFIADRNNNVIRKVDPAGIITTVAGYGLGGYSGEGIATANELYGPTSVVVDCRGNLFISDAASYRIRKVSTSGIISTIAGTGFEGYSGDDGPATAAKIGYVWDLALDRNDNVYFVDATHHRIRMINSVTGIITTAIGNGLAGYGGDGGPANLAEVEYPGGICIDDAGNIYFTDQGNMRLRKVNTAGKISTIAGKGIYPGYNGDNIAADTAQLWDPYDVAVDNAGNIYISDMGAQRIRKINTSGIITTIAGNGFMAGTNGGGFAGDGGPATGAVFHLPSGICTDLAGNVYVADEDNYRIRKIGTAPLLDIAIPPCTLAVGDVENKSTGIEVYPNPATSSLSVRSTVTPDTRFFITNTLGQQLMSNTLQKQVTEIDITPLPSGVYYLTIAAADGNVVKKFVKM